MSATAMWAVGIVVGILLSVSGFLAKFALEQMKSSVVELRQSFTEMFNKLIDRVDKISTNLDTNNKDIITVLNRNEINSQFIDNHTDEIEEIKEKIQKLELNCALNNHHKKATK